MHLESEMALSEQMGRYQMRTHLYEEPHYGHQEHFHVPELSLYVQRQQGVGRRSSLQDLRRQPQRDLSGL